MPDGADWRVVKYVHVAGSDAEARERVFSAQSAYRYAFGYLYEVLKRAGRLVGLKTHPDQPDSDVTVESIIEARVIYGSPQTVAEKLIAFRQRGRSVRPCAGDRHGLGRPQRGMGARVDAAPRRGGDAAGAAADGGAGGGIAGTTRPYRIGPARRGEKSREHDGPVP